MSEDIRVDIQQELISTKFLFHCNIWTLKALKAEGEKRNYYLTKR